MEKTITLDDPVTAGILEEILQEEDIPYILERNEDNSFGNLFLLAKGWATLRFNKEDEEKINSFLQEIMTVDLITD